MAGPTAMAALFRRVTPLTLRLQFANSVGFDRFIEATAQAERCFPGRLPCIRGRRERLVVEIGPVQTAEGEGPVASIQEMERRLQADHLPVDRAADADVRTASGDLSPLVIGQILGRLSRLAGDDRAIFDRFELTPPDPKSFPRPTAGQAGNAFVCPFGARLWGSRQANDGVVRLKKPVDVEITWAAVWQLRETGSEEPSYHVDPESLRRVRIVVRLSRPEDRETLDGRQILDGGLQTFVSASDLVAEPQGEPGDNRLVLPVEGLEAGAGILEGLNMGPDGRYIDPVRAPYVR